MSRLYTRSLCLWARRFANPVVKYPVLCLSVVVMSAPTLWNLDPDTLSLVCDFMTIRDHLALPVLCSRFHRAVADPRCWRDVHFGSARPTTDLIDLVQRVGLNIRSLTIPEWITSSCLMRIMGDTRRLPSLRHLKVMEVAWQYDAHLVEESALLRESAPVKLKLETLILDRVRVGSHYIGGMFSLDNMRVLALEFARVNSAVLASMPRLESLKLEWVHLIASKSVRVGPALASLKHLVLTMRHESTSHIFPWSIVPSTLQSLKTNVSVSIYLNFDVLEAPSYCELIGPVANTNIALCRNAEHLSLVEAIIDLDNEYGFPRLRKLSLESSHLSNERKLYESPLLEEVDLIDCNPSINPPIEVMSRLRVFGGSFEENERYPISSMAKLEVLRLQCRIGDEDGYTMPFIKGDANHTCHTLTVQSHSIPFASVFLDFPNLRSLTIDSDRDLDHQGYQLHQKLSADPRCNTSWRKIKHLTLIGAKPINKGAILPPCIETLVTNGGRVLRNIDFRHYHGLKTVTCEATTEDILSLAKSVSLEEVTVYKGLGLNRLEHLLHCPRLRLIRIPDNMHRSVTNRLRDAIKRKGKHVTVVDMAPEIFKGYYQMSAIQRKGEIRFATL